MGEFLALDLIAAHFVGDYILQTNSMAARKLADARIRALHVAVYMVPFALVSWLHAGASLRSVAFLACVSVAHFITDSRRWASAEPWPPKPIMVDQALHLVQLAIFQRILFP